MPRPVPRLPPMRCGLDPALRAPTVFSRVAVRNAGVSAGRLRRSDLEGLGGGLWRVRDRPVDLADVLRSLQDYHPQAAFSHVTALRVWGIDLPGWLEKREDIHLSLPLGAGRGAARAGVVLHRRVSSMPTRVVDGIRVSAPAWTLVDIAAEGAGHEDLVVLGDGMSRIGRTERATRQLPPGTIGAEALRRGVAQRAGHRGVVAARAAAEAVRDGADSPQETRLRLAIVAAGIPEPQVNPAVRLSAGQRLFVDLVWPAVNVAVEYDGDQHRTDRRQWREDVERDANLRAEGWTVIRVTADVFRPVAMELFLRHLRAALGL